MLDRSEVTESIANGIALLDSKVPDWRSRIDWETLDLYSFSDCILGQVFDGYVLGKYELGIEYESGSKYGFDGPRGQETDENYRQLEDRVRVSSNQSVELSQYHSRCRVRDWCWSNYKG